MKDKPRKPQPSYSDRFKLGVVMRLANGQLTKDQARIVYNIGGKSTILEWMRKFGYCYEPTSDIVMATPDGKSEAEQLKKKVRL